MVANMKHLLDKTNNVDDYARPEKRSRHGTPDSRDVSSDEERGGGPEGVMRVGRDYQALVPALIPPADRRNDTYPDKALLVWSPSPKVLRNDLDYYVSMAKDKYGYNAEQALGMLFWHKHDMKKAEVDLSNFTPFPDEWTAEDKVLFEQAFQFHGKSFQRIRQMLPDKTISSLVRHYYSWKKTRIQSSLMDKNARRVIVPKGNENGNAAPEEVKAPAPELSSSDSESEDKEKADAPPVVKVTCTNCGIPAQKLQVTAKGSLCGTCTDYLKKHGQMRPTTGPTKRDRQNVAQGTRRPPRGMYLDHDDLATFAAAQGKGEHLLRNLEGQVVSWKRKVQLNKQQISAVRRELEGGLSATRPAPRTLQKQWSNDEISLLLQGLTRFGKSVRVLAEVIGTKNESQVRSFMSTQGSKYNISDVLKEFENTQRLKGESVVKDENSVDSVECGLKKDSDDDEVTIL